jgi:hypothetical protein
VGQAEAEVSVVLDSALVCDLLKKGGRSLRVASDPTRLPRADLHPGGGQFDQALEKVREQSPTSRGSPQTLPHFVGFPVIAAIEEVKPEKVGTAVFPV